MSALASLETAIIGALHKYKHISFNKIMAGTLTPSDPVHIWLNIIQPVAMVLLPIQLRGLGEIVLLGKQRCVQVDMEMRKSDSESRCVWGRSNYI